MGVADGLQHSLAGMGFLELGLAFAALTGYALALNAALGSRFRRRSAALAALAALAFCTRCDPWVHGVVLVALAIGAMGAFVAAAWAVSALCGFGARETPVTETPSTFAEDLQPELEPVPAPVAVAIRPTARPIHSA